MDLLAVVFIRLSETVLPVFDLPGVFGPGILNTESSRLTDMGLDRVLILSNQMSI